uniref:CIDE-N domain-containing protein n=1 Tax=Macrostomum lignano TaxID=282301 RepID=A0A1I8FFR8_9PLAT
MSRPVSCPSPVLWRLSTASFHDLTELFRIGGPLPRHQLPFYGRLRLIASRYHSVETSVTLLVALKVRFPRPHHHPARHNHTSPGQITQVCLRKIRQRQRVEIFTDPVRLPTADLLWLMDSHLLVCTAAESGLLTHPGHVRPLDPHSGGWHRISRRCRHEGPDVRPAVVRPRRMTAAAGHARRARQDISETFNHSNNLTLVSRGPPSWSHGGLQLVPREECCYYLSPRLTTAYRLLCGNQAAIMEAGRLMRSNTLSCSSSRPPRRGEPQVTRRTPDYFL